MEESQINLPFLCIIAICTEDLGILILKEHN